MSTITDYYSSGTNTADKRPLSSSSSIDTEIEQPRKKMCENENLTAVLTKLSAKIDAIAERQSEITEIKTALNFISAQFDTMREERAEDRATIAALKSENTELKEKMGAIEHQVDCNQQYFRRNCVIVHGLDADPTRSTDERVIKCFKDKLNITIDPRDIDRSHPLPSTKKNPIIVKFARYNIRNLIFTNKKMLKGSGVSITESLTTRRLRVLNQAKEEHGFRSVWTSDGKILAKVGDRIKIILGN